jgi:hypothetical protein
MALPSKEERLAGENNVFFGPAMDLMAMGTGKAWAV